MKKSIEFYDRGIYAIMNEIVANNALLKIINKQIEIHQDRIIEEKATGKKARFYDRTIPITEHTYTSVGSPIYRSNGSGRHTHYARTTHYTTGGQDVYVTRKTIVKRLKNRYKRTEGEIKRLEKRLEKMKTKRQQLKEKLELKGIEVLEPEYEPIQDPSNRITLCHYCAYPLQESLIKCPVCGMQRL